MGLYLIMAMSMLNTFSVLAGSLGEEYESEQIKKGYFGIEGKQITPVAQSFCWEAAYEENNISNGPESKTDDYIAAKIFYHVYYIDCIEKSVRVGVRFVSVEKERKFCDRTSLEADATETIAKLKMIKNPVSGKFSKMDFNRFIVTLNQAKEARQESCARYAQRPIDPKINVNVSGFSLNFPNSIDNSSRTRVKEKIDGNSSENDLSSGAGVSK